LPIGAHSYIGDIATSFIYAFDTLLYMLAMIMVLGGMVGLYDSQARATGLLGKVGFLVAFLGMSLVLGFWWGQAFWVPAAAEAPPELPEDDPPSRLTLAYQLTFSLASLGWLLFGFATLLARVYPRSAAIILIFGAILSAFTGCPCNGRRLARIFSLYSKGRESRGRAARYSRNTHAR
jgi:hypothetical protein